MWGSWATLLYSIFSNKETWVVGVGNNTLFLQDKPSLAGIICLLLSFLPQPRPGTGSGIQKAGDKTSRGPLSGQAEGGKTNSATPPVEDPLPGGGQGAPRAKFPQEVTPAPQLGRNWEPAHSCWLTPRESSEPEQRPPGSVAGWGSRGDPSPGNALPSSPLPDLGRGEREAGVVQGPHQAELANFVVGHKAEDVLDGYDGQRHKRVVLRQLVRSQHRGWQRLGSRLWVLWRGRWGLSLGRAGGQRGAAVAVAAASFFCHPVLRRRRHFGGLIPYPRCKGNRDTSGASLPPPAAAGEGVPGGVGRSLWDNRRRGLTGYLSSGSQGRSCKPQERWSS